jgi:hypothetical protein
MAMNAPSNALDEIIACDVGENAAGRKESNFTFG